jgi:phosphoglycerate kinase
MAKALLSDLADPALRGLRVLVRADLNVPLDAAGGVTDDTRIRASIPTLERLTRAGARVVLLSHLGRPKGAPDPAFSLAPVARVLAAELDAPVRFVPELVGPQVDEAIRSLGDGELILLENTRFDARETTNDDALAEVLAGYGDLFVNDAFGTAHRAHASTEGVARHLRARGGRAVAGLLLARELRFLGEALAAPERPFVAILGGAKISGKIDVVEALLPRVDRLLIGGAMANTFLLALGYDVGRSLVEPDRVDMARALLDRAGDSLILPVDVRVADEIAPDAAVRVCPRGSVGPEERIGDIGPDTERLFAAEIRGARTVLWNGPMGVFEMTPFREGTVGVARAAADASEKGAVTVLGGGDSAAAAEVAGVAERLTHISTGGGASLEFLAGSLLPGIEALSEGGDR